MQITSSHFLQESLRKNGAVGHIQHGNAGATTTVELATTSLKTA